VVHIAGAVGFAIPVENLVLTYRSKNISSNNEHKRDERRKSAVKLPSAPAALFFFPPADHNSYHINAKEVTIIIYVIEYAPAIPFFLGNHFSNVLVHLKNEII
jgi:hypothetical protein